MVATQYGQKLKQAAGKPRKVPPADKALASPGESAHAAKIRERRFRWQWNRNLGYASIGIVVVIAIISAVSYNYHSKTAADTFMLRADTAQNNGNYIEQEKWLHRYLLLKPDDLEAVVKVALSADASADSASPETVASAVQNARKQLSMSIARLGEDNPETVKDLRGRLIGRLLQLGGVWLREAEYQVVLLNAPHSDAHGPDPQAVKWLAMSMIGQVKSNAFEERSPTKYKKDVDYWNWLSHQKIGYLLTVALEAKQNEQDLDLIASFLEAYITRPELFDFDEGTIGSGSISPSRVERLRDQVAAAVATLMSNQDSRSKLILYNLQLADGREADARRLLADSAKDASRRLAEFESSEAENASQARGGELPDYYWDYTVLMQAARIVAAEDPPAASNWFGQLMRLDLPAIPVATREKLFVIAGSHQIAQDNLQQAVEIWNRGLEEVNPNSLDLLGSLAQLHARGDDQKLADEAIDKLRQAVEFAQRRLLKATEGELSRTARVAFARRIETANWRLGVMEADQSIREGHRTRAVRQLSDALGSSAEIDVDERLPVALRLASLYGSQGSWDQAASTIERAIYFAPDNLELRAKAARAWLRSGNRLHAMQQWQVAGRSESLRMRIASTEAMFNYQLRLLPEQRDFSGVRSEIKRLREQMAAEQDEAAGDQWKWADGRLSVLEISLPPKGVVVEEHLQSSRMVDGLAKISVDYPQEETIQALAAERLAVAGRIEESNQAMKRLESIAGESATSVAIVKARIEASQDNHVAACQRLIQQAELDESRSEELLLTAASIASSGTEIESAYQAISLIPERGRTLSAHFFLAQLAARLPADSKYLVRDGQHLTPDELSIQIGDQLRHLEGKQGSYWRFLKATRLIDQLRKAPNSVSRSDPRFIEAKDHVREILSWRPRWGEAISLEGWLSAIEGKPKKAVDQLRRGIEAGDRRLQTRQRLWEQLILLNRDLEADQAIRLASLAKDVEVDKYATTRIGLAMRQGNYQRSLELAEATIQERPTDYLGYVVLCRTATIAAGEASGEQREHLMGRAVEAIETAAKMAGKDDDSIFSATLAILSLDLDKQRTLAEISRIQASDLDQYAKLVLESKAQILLKEFETAESLLQRALKIKPSTQVALAIAELSRRQGRIDCQIDALREALRIDPDRSDVRNLLARAIVDRDPANVQWNEVADLLSGDASGRYAYAVLLIKKGTDICKTEAMEILRELGAEDNNFSDGALRVLAALLRERAKERADAPAAQRDRWLSEARAILESLSQRRPSQAVDLYNHAGLLLDLDNTDDLPIVQRLLRELRSLKDGAYYALEIDIISADKMGKSDSVPEIVQDFYDQSIGKESSQDAGVTAAIAGSSLLRRGYIEEGLRWLDRSYQADKKGLAMYVRELVKYQKLEKAITICTDQFQTEGDARSATLFVEMLMRQGARSIPPAQEQLIQKALESHGRDVGFLESVATLRLQQGRYDEAIRLYERNRKIDPFRIRTLNNLAMALSEAPGRAAEGVEPIDSAIKLAGDDPELLDTKGVVLLKAGRPDDAIAVFQQAIRIKTDEPLYQFHLVLGLLAQDEKAKAKEAWDALDLERLSPFGLTPAEKQKLAELKNDFRS